MSKSKKKKKSAKRKKPVTEKQLRANGINGPKSKGPTSDEGKKTSSMNALKHGLDAETDVLPWEDKAEYICLLQEVWCWLRPTNAIERTFVKKAADSLWRQQRGARFETLAMPLAETLQEILQVMDKVTKFETKMERMYTRAINQLAEYRAQMADLHTQHQRDLAPSPLEGEENIAPFPHEREGRVRGEATEMAQNEASGESPEPALQADLTPQAQSINGFVFQDLKARIFSGEITPEEALEILENHPDDDPISPENESASA